MIKDSDMNLKTFAQPLRGDALGCVTLGKRSRCCYIHTEYGDVNDELGGLLLLGIFVFLYICMYIHTAPLIARGQVAPSLKEMLDSKKLWI